MHDIHPNEVAKLVSTVQQLHRRVARIESATLPRDEVEVAAAPVASKAETPATGTGDIEERLAAVEEIAKAAKSDLVNHKMRLGDISSRTSSVNEKANTLRKDFDKLSKLVADIQKQLQPSEAPVTE